MYVKGSFIIYNLNKPFLPFSDRYLKILFFRLSSNGSKISYYLKKEEKIKEKEKKWPGYVSGQLELYLSSEKIVLTRNWILDFWIRYSIYYSVTWDGFHENLPHFLELKLLISKYKYNFLHVPRFLNPGHQVTSSRLKNCVAFKLFLTIKT